ncbi:MFS family permease [Bradyrhizobium sp. USDA 4524]|uniref:MFS transporter n=1 Tax=unclassified Bradyrhizobium TaxID=2631580 RepID=UPI0020A0566B|nr:MULTISPECIES: MFS transporter [unclassified Bradyrhizobium]MCP1846052.1 MFS family permease [Bradyrhizobium sp. USDA 4538]MCP1907314.1 MFS family permease [Bradyrhizobium sp. USDA 4537]MCP1985790.1 MFS family permease [Bradyrhizobium sp. USDA 4539]
MSDPATPTPPTTPPPYSLSKLRASAYVIASIWLALTQGLAMNLISVNIPQIQGAIAATTSEANWLIAAYWAPNVSLALALIKVRTQFGLRNFAEASIALFVGASLLNLYIMDLNSAVVTRFLNGIAAAPISTLGFLYMMEAFPPNLKLRVGAPLALMNTTLGTPIARLISPYLFDIQGLHSIAILDVGLALVAFGFVYMLPLSQPQPRAKVIEKIDVLSYLLIATGMGCTAIVLSLGRLYWWFEAPWLGVLLAIAFATITASVLIELNRKNPLLNIRWLVSPGILHFAGVLLLFRLLLSEQTTGAAGMFLVLGLSNAQMATLYWVILGASIAGGLTCAAVMQPGRATKIHLVALALIAVGAWLDSQSTSLTRPNDLLVSQAMIAFASALFLPPAMIAGLTSALAKGPNYILSFVIIFLSTQSVGGLLGSAIFGTFITLREKLHSNYLVEHIALTDPIVAQRISQLGGAYSRVLTDKALLNAEGIALLSQQATREANVLAYNDAFLLISIVTACAFLILLVRTIAKAAIRAVQPSPQPTGN